MSASAIVAAVIRCGSQVGVQNKDKNLTRTLEVVAGPADHGANLGVLPDAARGVAYAHAEELTGPGVQAWTDPARSCGIHLGAGFTEVDRVRLSIGPDRVIGRYRKTHLWHREKLVFTPWDLGFPVFWDIWFPGLAHLLAAQGGDDDLPRDRRRDLYDPLLGCRGGQAYPR